MVDGADWEGAMVEAQATEGWERAGHDGHVDHLTPAAPRGTVTFLLTDVEGSSRLWETHPAEAHQVLDRRLAIIRTASERHGGVLPLEQGEGDSSVSAFARASDAAACAIDIQRDLSVEEWPAGIEIRVRIALHTGEAEVRSDGTYHGSALNRCARVRSMAHGGQILLSQATYEVVVDGLPEQLALRHLGSYRLRDLARPEHVWQLCHPDLPSAFPPLTCLEAVAHNLPPQLTSFVGREAELDALTAALAEQRLLTLTGAGGAGKTRLALQLASGLGTEHPDGVWWVDLAPLADPSMVPAALAAVVGVRESPVESITDTVVRQLGSSRAVVILDNCEHLIDACAALAAGLIQGCPAVRLIATSREPLRVDGETTWTVPSLGLPDPDDAEGSDRSEAVRLFVDRARAARPSFTLDGASAPAVAEICRRLDGIPLAIELAAARTRVLTVDQIAAALADRFHLLTGGARTALPRQRTLESSVDWSHDLLDDRERAAFRRMAVFAGSFTLDAAQVVCGFGGLAPTDVLDLLCALVDRSLVQVADATGPQTRYRLLETIRDYARHKLTDAGEAEEARDRHQSHYVTFAQEAAAGLEGPDLTGWLARVDAELDNLRAVLDWGPHSADADGGARLVGLLCLYWFARSEIGIGRARLAGSLDHAKIDGSERADALSALCMVNYRSGEMAEAGRLGDEAIALARRLGDESVLARALHWRAWVHYWGEGDRVAAWAEFEEAATLLRNGESGAYLPLNLGMHAWSCITTSEVRRARALVDEGLALTSVVDAPHGRCYCLVSLGYLGLMEGRFDEAAVRLGEAVRLAHDIGDHYAEVCARMFCAHADLFLGRYREAEEHVERGLAIALANRSPNCESFMRLAGGTLALAEGRLGAAAEHLESAYAFSSVHFPSLVPFVRGSQAQVALARSCPGDALDYADEAIRLGQSYDVCFAVQSALLTRAALARLDGDGHTAEDRCNEALQQAVGLDMLPSACDALETLGGAVADQSRYEEAARILGAAQRLRDDIGYVGFPVREPARAADFAAVRDGLGPDAFDRAWAEGSGLSLAEAVAYARRGRGERKRPSHGWQSLTPTELQVVDLVAEGLTNRQIGERLLVSPRTVQTHVAHIFAKIGVATRAELAAAATRRS